MNFNIFKSNNIVVSKINAISRDRNVIRQIGSSVIFKFISVAISFFITPILVTSLGNERYGIWATLLNIMQWMALMDVGIGNGLKIKLTEALSKGDLISAREYVSTAYILMGSIGLILISIFVPVSSFFDWNIIFNTTLVSNNDLKLMVLIFVFTVINYVTFTLINQILSAVQRSSLSSLILITGNIFFIVSLLIFSKIKSGHENDLILITSAYSGSLILSIIVISVFFFNEYKYLIPSLKYFQKTKINVLINLGVKFFIMQIVSIIIFLSDNIIITQLLGPSFVTIYTLPLILFNNIGMFISVLMMPLWSSYTEAYSKDDLVWIKKKILLLVKLIIPLVLSIIILTYYCNDILHYWLKKDLNIPRYLPILFAVYTVITVWNNIFGYVLGGIGKIKLGMYTSILVGILNIPLAIFFVKNLNMGLYGVILSNISCLLISSIVSPIQVYYFIFSKNKNIFWEKLLE